MIELYNAYQSINNLESIAIEDLIAIEHNSEIADFQYTSLITQILLNNNNLDYESGFIDRVLNANKDAKYYIQLFEEAKNNIDNGYNYEGLFIKSLYNKIKIGKKVLTFFMNQITSRSINLNFLSIILVLIKNKGLKYSDTKVLTELMCNSGDTFDYRNSSILHHRKVVRRYPTGALSEKIALIMPSLLMAFSKEFEIVSPFTIAKSMSFTGGTWDKLKSIPGFVFPQQGHDTILVLSKCNISMSVTDSNYNPADSFLYQFRSITNTVDSHSLIVSSIASKQLGVPADSLLLDIRFGSGAFLKNLAEAHKLNQDITKLLIKKNIKCKAIYTKAEQPIGSTIGNYWEVLEAAIIMGYESKLKEKLNLESLKEQLGLVIKMTSELLNMEFIHIPIKELERKANEFFKTGQVIDCFIKLLKVHGVNENVIDELFTGRLMEVKNLKPSMVYASKSGTLSQIDQKQIGLFVNFELGGGRNDFTGKTNYYSGMMLSKRLNQPVKKGDVLAIIMHTHKISEKFLNSERYFKIN